MTATQLHERGGNLDGPPFKFLPQIRPAIVLLVHSVGFSFPLLELSEAYIGMSLSAWHRRTGAPGFLIRHSSDSLT